jgi:hypothetical protein
MNPKDMEPESLRRHLVGALRYGSSLVIAFGDVTGMEILDFFSDTFPAATMQVPVHSFCYYNSA